MKTTIFYTLLILIIGSIINKFNPYHNFYLHMCILITILIISLYSVRQLLNFFDDDKIIVEPNTKPVELKIISQKWAYSNLSLVISLIVVAFYFFGIFKLKYIVFNPVGVYALCLGALALFFAIVGYYLFVTFIIFFIRIAHLDVEEIKSYTIFSPSNSEWLIKLAIIKKKFQNIFLFLGFLFSLEYALLVPKGAINYSQIVLQNNQKFLNVESDFWFISTWLIIILGIIIAFPVYVYLLHRSIKKIIGTLKRKTISELEFLINISYENKKMQDVYDYLQMIHAVEKSPDYPISNKLPISSIILSISTIAVQFVKIIPFIAEKINH